MEMFYMLLGLVMFFFWGYSLYIIFTRNGRELTNKEKGVLITGAIFLALWFIGTFMEDEPKVPQTRYECLQLGSDLARTNCINTYGL